MDAVEQRQINSYSVTLPQSSTPAITVSKKTQHSNSEREQLILKITYQQKKNNEQLQRQQSLQNTLHDLRTLLHNTSNENETYCKNIEKENALLSQQVSRLTAATRAVYRNGKHIQSCALFWREFV